MKFKQFLLSAALLTFAISLMIYPAKATASSRRMTELPAITSSFTLLPPLCFVNEMYETEDKEAAVTPDEIFSDENVVVKVRFKFFDVIMDFFRTHF